MIPSGHTSRLLLRPIELADAPQIQEHFPHWEVVRYLLNRVPWPYPSDGAERHLREILLPAMQQGNHWAWSLRMRSSPEQLIGMIDLQRSAEYHRGFWLGGQWQGQGLMSEACAWTSNFWFETLGFPLLRVSKAVQNTASRRISEKHGMRLVAQTEQDYVSGRLSSEVWELTAEEWKNWKASHPSYFATYAQ